MDKVTVNGKIVDLVVCFPLKMKDWRALEDVGVPRTAFSDGLTSNQMVKFIAHVLGKDANAQVNESDVDEMTLDEVGEVFTLLVPHVSRKRAVDRPTSTGSTISPPSTDGGRPSSAN